MMWCYPWKYFCKWNAFSWSSDEVNFLLNGCVNKQKIILVSLMGFFTVHILMIAMLLKTIGLIVLYFLNKKPNGYSDFSHYMHKLQYFLQPDLTGLGTRTYGFNKIRLHPHNHKLNRILRHLFPRLHFVTWHPHILYDHLISPLQIV